MRASKYGRTAGIVLLLATLVALAGLGVGRAPTAYASGCPYSVATATSGNTFADWVGLGWNDPTMLAFITPNWEPNAVFDNHAVGVWYDGSEWAAFNEDGAPMPTGASFNVFVTWGGGSSLSDAFVQTATGGNVSGDATIVNDPLANNNPAAILLVTPNWNPGGRGGSGLYNNHPIGVYYTGSNWAIFNEDGALMTIGEAFNVLVLSGASGDANSGASVHTATTTATSGNTIRLSPSPAASTTLLVTPNWNPPGHAGVYFPHNLGVTVLSSYFGSPRPAIFTQDVTAIPVGASFNVLAHPSCP